MTSLRNRLQNSTALAVTVALHAGIAAIALLAVTVTAPDKPRDPIITRAIPDTIEPPPTPVAPPLVERPFTADITAPIVIIDTPAPPIPDQASVVYAPGEPALIDPGPVADPVPPARGPTQAARFDPRFKTAMQPPYPDAARRLAEEGAVVVTVRIGRDGRVLAASLAQSSGSPRLDAAAVAHALKRWRFTPALADGDPVEATRTITVNFRLADA